MWRSPNKGSFFFIRNKYIRLYERTYWTEVDSWLTDSLYLHPKFKKFFDERAGECRDGLYPTVSIRQIMWALKMKPIQRQRYDIDIQLNEITTTIADGKTHLRVDVDAEIGKDELINILKSIGLN